MFQLLMNQQLSDKISTTSQDFWKPRCNQNVRFRMQEEENQTVVVTKPQQLFILWLWEYTYCRTSICYSIVQTRVQLVFGLSKKKVKYLIWLFKTVFFVFFLDPPTRVMFWTRKRRMMTSSSAVLDRSSTVIGPNCCSPGSGQYCRQGWGERERERGRRQQVISPRLLEAGQIIMSAASDGEAQ